MQKVNSKVLSQNDPYAIKVGADIIKKGGLIVAPTDTLYGILADATSYTAVEKLYELRRPSRKPFIVLIPNTLWAEKLCGRLDYRILRLLSFPGLTVVLGKSSQLFYFLGIKSVALRVPQKGFVRKLLMLLDKPLVAPSANQEGKPPARRVEEAIAFFGEKVDLYIDGGSCYGRPSTVVDLRKNVYREGCLSKKTVEKIFELTCKIPCPEQALSQYFLYPCRSLPKQGS